ncbi:MAG: hypothetical protein AAF530_17800 [Pseudomonadota bacterium]
MTSVPALRKAWHFAIVVILTLLTQIGGLAWLVSLAFKKQKWAFITIYLVMTGLATQVAPLFGRVAIGCWESGPLEVQSWLYCGLNRNYVTPELKGVLLSVAKSVEQEYPGTKTVILDAGFPFLDGFPMVPHLSHSDGEKVDLAFFYRDHKGYLPGETKSPIGYLAFEAGPTDCPDSWLTLRWGLKAVQPLWRNLDLEPDRTKFLIDALGANPQIDKILLEPHLKERFDISSDKVRFQGCRAARHDDHIHIQL